MKQKVESIWLSDHIHHNENKFKVRVMWYTYIERPASPLLIPKSSHTKSDDIIPGLESGESKNNLDEIRQKNVIRW